MHSFTSDESLVASAAHALGRYVVYATFAERKAGHGNVEVPSGLPHSHGLRDWTYVFSHRKGLVTDVSGPQRNACPGTLKPLGPEFCIGHREVCGEA
jgi:hypothetical protein